MNEEKVYQVMVDAGTDMAMNLYDADISKSLEGTGNIMSWEEWNNTHEVPNQDLIVEYVNRRIDSVEAIYRAMVRAKKQKGGKK